MQRPGHELGRALPSLHLVHPPQHHQRAVAPQRRPSRLEALLQHLHPPRVLHIGGRHEKQHRVRRALRLGNLQVRLLLRGEGGDAVRGCEPDGGFTGKDGGELAVRVDGRAGVAAGVHAWCGCVRVLSWVVVGWVGGWLIG